MNFSSLSAADKRILIVAIGTIIGLVAAIADGWGIGGILGGLAGLGAAGVVLQPQLAPAMKLPMPKATLLLVLGAVAAGGFLLAGLQYLSYVLDITRIFSILFDVGLVSALALAYFAWLGYQAAQGTPAAPDAAAPPPPPAAPEA
jgi:hypothetical protein